MHLVQIGSAEAAAAEEEVYTDNKAIPSLALSFELGLGMAISYIYTSNCDKSLTLGKTNMRINLNIIRIRTERNT